MLFLCVCAAYANSFKNEFHFDDFHTITENPAVRSLRNIPRYFIDAGTFSVLPANRTYRPVVSTSLAVDYALGNGYVPFWFHLSTFLCFLVLLALLYLLNQRVFDVANPAGKLPLTNNATLALLTAGWFGLHPAMAETVNYIIQRGDIFCTTGCVAALVVWARYPSWRKTGIYLLPFCLALLSKPPAAVFPVLLLFYVFFFEFPEGRGRWKRSIIAALPAVAVTAAGLWLQSAMTPKSFAPSILSAADYRLTQPFVWLRYFTALFLPLHLNVDSDLNPISTLDARAFSGILFALALIAVIVWAARRRARYPIAFGLIWFFVTQLPTSAYALSEVENDHRMFFSFPGLMIAVVWAARLTWQRTIPSHMQRSMRPLVAACVVTLLCGYAWGVRVRNQAWRTEETLWRDDVQKSPHNGRGLMIYGLTQMQKGAFSEALNYFKRAQIYTPNYSTLEINLGVVYSAMHFDKDAEAHFLRAILLTPADDEVYTYYARWLMAQGRLDEANAATRRAIALNPQRPMQRDLLLSVLAAQGDAVALRTAARDTLQAVPGDAMAKAVLQHPEAAAAAEAINRSLSQYREGKYTESIQSAGRALQLDPRRAEAYNNIGAAYGAMGQWDDAIAAENKALALDPRLEIARNNLAEFSARKRKPAVPSAPTAAEWINRSLALNQAGKFEESIAAAKAALAIDPHSAEAWNNIAANEQAMHRWDDAIAAARKAIGLRPDFQLAKNNLAWSESQKKLSLSH